MMTRTSSLALLAGGLGALPQLPPRSHVRLALRLLRLRQPGRVWLGRPPSNFPGGVDAPMSSGSCVLKYSVTYGVYLWYLKWLGFFFGIPALIGVMGTIMGMQIELDAMREADDGLQAGSVDAVSFEPFDDFDAISPPRDGGTRIIDDGRRRDGL